MQIRFTEDRILLDMTKVSAGDEMDFPEDEARGFVNNGVAEFVDPADAQTEVIDNG